MAPVGHGTACRGGDLRGGMRRVESRRRGAGERPLITNGETCRTDFLAGADAVHQAVRSHTSASSVDALLGRKRRGVDVASAEAAPVPVGTTCNRTEGQR